MPQRKNGSGSRTGNTPGRRPVAAKRSERYHHGDLRSALVAAALELIERAGGGSGWSLREAARLAGVSEAAPYRHFADKNELVATVAQEGFVALEERLAAVSARSPRRRLVELGVAYVRFAAERPAHYRVMFGRELVDKTAYPGLEEVGARAFEHLRQVVAAGQRAGRLRAGDPRALALTAWSAVHGLASLLVDGQVRVIGLEGRSVEELARHLARDLMRGLGRPARSRPRNPTSGSPGPG